MLWPLILVFESLHHRMPVIESHSPRRSTVLPELQLNCDGSAFNFRAIRSECILFFWPRLFAGMGLRCDRRRRPLVKLEARRRLRRSVANELLHSGQQMLVPFLRTSLARLYVENVFCVEQDALLPMSSTVRFRKADTRYCTCCSQLGLTVKTLRFSTIPTTVLA